jgi:predicted Fe-Mo cluster-binding NifX family protein
MKRLILVFSSDDGTTMLDDHFGEGKDFYLYAIDEQGNYKLIEARPNTSPDEEGNAHGLEEKRVAVLDILNEANVIVSRQLSPNLIKMRDKAQVQPILTDIESIEVFLREFKGYFNQIFDMVENRKQGIFLNEIPRI